jgi:hypothetical protein
MKRSSAQYLNIPILTFAKFIKQQPKCILRLPDNFGKWTIACQPNIEAYKFLDNFDINETHTQYIDFTENDLYDFSRLDLIDRLEHNAMSLATKSFDENFHNIFIGNKRAIVVTEMKDLDKEVKRIYSNTGKTNLALIKTPHPREYYLVIREYVMVYVNSSRIGAFYVGSNPTKVYFDKLGNNPSISFRLFREKLSFNFTDI